MKKTPPCLIPPLLFNSQNRNSRTPESRHLGVPKLVQFWTPFWEDLDPKMAPKTPQKLVNKLIILGSIFGSLFWSFGAPWVPLGSLLGLPKALLGCLWTPKTFKTLGFLRCLQMQVFGSLKLSMAVLGLSWPLGPIWSQNGPQNSPQNGPQNGVILRSLLTMKNGSSSCFQDGSKMAQDGLK